MDLSNRSALQSNTALHTFWLIRLGFSQINQKTHTHHQSAKHENSLITHTIHTSIRVGKHGFCRVNPCEQTCRTTQCLPLCVSNRCYRRPSQHKQCHWFQQFRLKWILCGTRRVARETSRSQHNSINIQSIPVTVTVDFFRSQLPGTLPLVSPVPLCCIIPSCSTENAMKSMMSRTNPFIVINGACVITFQR